MSVSFVLVVADGLTLRTLHPAGLGAERAAAIAAVLADYFEAEGPASGPVPGLAALLTQREIATASGFTGDVCAQCQGFAMVRAGTCLTCRDCGATTGCS